METLTPLDEALALAARLSPIDKVRLVERVMTSLEADLGEGQLRSKRSLWGLWSGVQVSDEDLESVRQHITEDFPRKDL